ncbi:RCC1 domain-containing protein [Melittangium boletus]|uniref:RCC1 domain-containing protein n=1 Tax=Melittangium boletus TaxID=83453 RepID=UPI003DA6A950
MSGARRGLALLLLGVAAACGPAPEVPSPPPPEAPPDTQAPEVRLLSPREAQVGAVYQVRARGTLADDRGVVRATWSLNGQAPVDLSPTGDFTLEGTPRPGTNVLRVEAVDAAGNTGVAEVRFVLGSPLAGGLSHSAAVREGQLYTWGDNGVGQLGRRTDTGPVRPASVPGLDRVSTVVTGASGTLVLQEDGSAWAWGSLPPGLVPPREAAHVPTRIPTPAPVVGASLGGAHALLLLADGTVLAAGANAAGQLGLGSTATVDGPTRVPGLERIVRVAAGSAHSVALRADGAVFVWGSNGDGQLGNGEVDDAPHPEPFQVTHLERVVDVAAGRAHVLALGEEGRVRAWGLGSSGQLGQGKSGMLGGRAQPVEVLDVTGAESVSAQANSSFALSATGALWAWGQNSNAQLGDGTTAERPRAVQVKGLGAARAVGPGSLHVLALTGPDACFAWGANTSGQLGASTSSSGASRSAVPLRVEWP